LHFCTISDLEIFIGPDLHVNCAVIQNYKNITDEQVINPAHGSPLFTPDLVGSDLRDRR